MAVAVIGGLITSTVLSLLVVPAVFTFVDDVEQFFKRQFRRKPSVPASGGGDALKPQHPAL